MKRTIIVILILCFIAPVNIIAKKKRLGKGVYWELNNSVLTISGKGNMPDRCYLIWKDQGNIEKIIIEDGVKSIGKSAFFNCYNLHSAVISSTVTSIGEDAFYGCHDLKTLSIPNSVTSIRDGAFGLCFSLETEVPNSVKFIGDKAFLMCYHLHGGIPSSVTSIGQEAFYYCMDLKSVDIPHSVSAIGDSTFSKCMGLEAVMIPGSVKTIGKGVFSDCYSLQSLVLPNHLMTNLTREKWCEWGLPENRFDEYKLFHEMKNSRIITKCYDYYIVEEDKGKGVIDQKGNWILPCSKAWSGFSYFHIINENYVKVKDNNGYGICTKEGMTIIPTDRGYTSIGNYDSVKRTFAFTKIGYTGECNARGQEISLVKIPPTSDDIKANGGYTSAVEMKNGSTKYYKVSKGGRYGLTDSEGKEIVPCEMEALESAGTGYLKYKINGFWGVLNYAGKIIIGTDRGYTSIGNFVTFTKRFPYTMAGWKGECDINGRPVSKIKVEIPQQTVAKQETTTPQKQEEEKKIIIEHKHDPIPVNVWVQCNICGGSGRCQTCGGSGIFTGWSGNKTLCEFGCGGSGKCSFCAGHGGHYEVEYK